MRPIDKIIAHWKATKGVRGQAEGFGGLTVYWREWTLGQQDQVFGPFTDAAGRVIMRPALFARMLIVKAEDAEGKPLFSPTEEIELLAEADPREIHRIGMLMLNSLNRTNEAAADADDPKAKTAP